MSAYSDLAQRMQAWCRELEVGDEDKGASRLRVQDSPAFLWKPMPTLRQKQSRLVQRRVRRGSSMTAGWKGSGAGDRMAPSTDFSKKLFAVPL